MEYADGGDLAGEIEKRQRARKPYTEGELINRFADCVKAVNNMHKKGVVHRDIKPANIFLNKDGPAKLGDLGIAEQCSKNGRCSTPIGTPLYLDPQRINNKSYGQKADVWSLGCVLYEMAALQVWHKLFTSVFRYNAIQTTYATSVLRPFNNCSTPQKAHVLHLLTISGKKQPAFNARSMADLKSKINRGQVDLSKLPKEYSPEVGQMIKEMLQLGEPKRASVESIMSNPLVDKELRRRSSSVAPAKAAPTVPKHMEAEDQGARGRSSSLPAHLRDGARGGARPRSVSPVARRESVADAAAAVKAANAAPRARGRSPTAHPIGPREAHRRSVSPLVQAAEVKAAVGAARERGRSISPVPPSSSRPGGAALRRRSSSPVVVGRGRIGSENGPSPLARVSEAPTAVKIPSKLGAREIREATPENLAPAQSMLGVANGVNRAMFPSDAARGKAVSSPS